MCSSGNHDGVAPCNRPGNTSEGYVASNCRLDITQTCCLHERFNVLVTADVRRPTTVHTHTQGTVHHTHPLATATSKNNTQTPPFSQGSKTRGWAVLYPAPPSWVARQDGGLRSSLCNDGNREGLGYIPDDITVAGVA